MHAGLSAVRQGLEVSRGLTRGCRLGVGRSIICVVVSCIADAPCDALLAHATRRLPECTYRCTANAADVAPLRHVLRLLLVTKLDPVSIHRYTNKTLKTILYYQLTPPGLFALLVAANTHRCTHTQRLQRVLRKRIMAAERRFKDS